MTPIVIGMVVIIVVALVVLSVFSEEDDDWSHRARRDPAESSLDDLFDD
jgi:hypothetical protein